MRHVILAGLILLAAPAMAQTVNDTSGSNSGSTSTAGSQSTNTNHLTNVGNQSATGAIAGTQVNAPISSRSGSRSGSASTSGSTSSAQSGTSTVSVGPQRTSSSVKVVNVTGYGSGTNGTNGTNATDPAGANGTNGANSADPPALGSAGNPLTENIGGTTTLRNTPEIIAPNISGGNPCLVGISGGGAGPGIGITLGIGYSDKGCERRNSAALLSNIGQRDVAIELMCDDQAVREAMARSGHPCAADRAVAAPVAAVDPAVVRRQQDAATPVQVATKPARPDWCQTASAAELRTHPACD
jgi:hypothetical protein